MVVIDKICDFDTSTKVAIVLLNYQGALDTIDCIQSLRDIPGDWVVVVVDNSSADESIATLRNYFQKEWSGQWIEWKDTAPRPENLASNSVILVRSSVNRGFAGGNNLGIDVALGDQQVTHVWILNNDTIVNLKSLECLLETMAEKSADLVGGALENLDGSIQAYFGIYSPWSGVPYHVKSPIESLTEDCYLIGASILVRSEVLRRSLRLDESFFLYCEDAEFSFRARSEGLKLAISSKSRVVHKDGASSSSELKEYYFVRNSVRLLALRKKFGLLVWYLIHYIIARKVLGRLVQGRMRLSLAAWTGFVDAVRGKHGKR